MATILQAYGDLCILARKRVDKTLGGVVVPERSNEGANFQVISVGSIVPKNIRPGMLVQIVGEVGKNFSPVPGFPDLIVISAQFVCYRFLEVTPEEFEAWRYPETNKKPEPPQEESK